MSMRWLAVAGCALLCGCGDSSNSGGGGTGQTQGGALEGHWSSKGSRLQKGETEVDVSVTSSSLSIVSNGGSLSAISAGNGAMSVTYRTSSTERQAVARPGSRGSGLGVVPLAADGAWSFEPVMPDETRGCTTSLVGDKVEGGCRAVSGFPAFLGSSNFAYGQAVGSRVEQRTSVFGALSGKWQVSLSGGGSCEMLFEGSMFRATCTDARDYTGTLEVNVGNDVVSGFTSTGIEFSATR